MLGFAHEYTRADYERTCGGASTGPAKVPTTLKDSAVPGLYGETVSLIAKDGRYAGDYLLEGREAGLEVMVHELVTVTKSPRHPNRTCPCAFASSACA